MSLNTVCNTTLAQHADHLNRPAWLDTAQAWLTAWKRRRRIARLLDYDDHLLDDMGHRRADLLDALQLPVKADVEGFLQQRKNERRRTG